MKKWLAVTWGILTAGFITFFGLYSSNRLLYMKKKEEEDIIKRESMANRLSLADFNTLPKEEVTIPSPFGYDLHTYFIHPYNSKRYVVFCHGVTETKWNSIKYMNIFLKRGFNAVIYDHRRHGQSGGKTTSFGHYEKHDLKAVIEELRRRIGEDAFIGIHGESMGAATMLLYAGGLKDCADFYIADCSFSDFQAQFLYRFKMDTKVNGKWLLPITNLFLKYRGGFTFKEVSPLSVMRNISKPILFIHSQDDDFILPIMTKALFQQKTGDKMLYIADKGAHAQSYNENPEQYERVIDEFLTTYLM
ncbi:alpha/beta hydrolase [Bacillus spongiae]|uniref:Alpha/beta hydrolase n=1 Tax=Bacillus spongiae TaxID=2683610 RepID=A0ABU8HCS6_9BACI